MKESKKNGWFRRLGGKTNDFSLFCPASPGGKLATKWRQVLEEVRESSGGLIRGYVAEKSGIPLSALLFNTQPGEKDHCARDDCNPCRRGTTKKLSCRKVSLGGMVYACTCLSCKMAVEEKVSKYHGRTARTLYTRQAEHISGCEAGKADNALFNPPTSPPLSFWVSNLSRSAYIRHSSSSMSDCQTRATTGGPKMR